MRVAFYNLGCKVNSYELMAIEFIFKQNNFDIVDFDSISDIYVINTCSVTNQSDVKSRKTIRAARRRNPDACIAVMGCFSQLNAEKCAEIGCDIILGTSNRNKLFDLVMEYLKTHKKIFLHISIVRPALIFDILKSFIQMLKSMLQLKSTVVQYRIIKEGGEGI